MGLVEVICFFGFHDKPLAGTDVGSLQPERIPGGSFFCPLRQRPQQYLLPVLFQISLSLQLNQLENLAKVFQRVHFTVAPFPASSNSPQYTPVPTFAGTVK